MLWLLHGSAYLLTVAPDHYVLPVIHQFGAWGQGSCFEMQVLWQGTKLETWANAKDVWHFRTSWRFLWLLHLSKRVKKGKEKSSWASGKGPCNSHKVSMLFCEVFAHLKNIIFKFTISLFCVGMWVSLLFKYSGENECGICVICDILKYDLEI